MTETGSSIDELRDDAGGLDREAIRRILPYGDEFLFVDNVASLSRSEVEASFDIPEDASYLRSHFVGLPLMPGVLIGEGMAQAGTLIVRYCLEHHEEKDILAFQIDGARFSGSAQPGDRLHYEVRLRNLRSNVARLEGRTLIDGREICSARLVLGIVERAALSERLRTKRGQ